MNEWMTTPTLPTPALYAYVQTNSQDNPHEKLKDKKLKKNKE